MSALAHGVEICVRLYLTDGAGSCMVATLSGYIGAVPSTLFKTVGNEKAIAGIVATLNQDRKAPKPPWRAMTPAEITNYKRNEAGG